MKEAAGEANMTVITIVLIGIVAAVGVILVPRILDGSSKKAACGELGGNLTGNTCVYKEFITNPSGVEKKATCSKCADSTPKKGTWVCGDAATLCK